MRILFEQGIYDMRNKGNVALTQVAVSRLRKFWPQAAIEVITSTPQILQLFIPNALPIRSNGQPYSNRLTHTIPLPLLRLMLEAREEVWHRWPNLGRNLKALFRLKGNRNKPTTEAANSRPLNEERGDPTAFNQVAGRDLIVATGAQYMSDACRDDAFRVLDRMEVAHRLGIPTAMVGQGFGPFDDPELRARARSVLPQVDLIFARDRLSVQLLVDSLGVDSARVIFTGDDAIEMAYDARTQILGTVIGVSLRIAPYTQLTAEHIEIIRPVLHRAATTHNTALTAIPISHNILEQDDRVINQILNGARNALHSRWRFEPPREIIKIVGHCRIVVTGAFHTAVFALAQGIPAIGLAQSVMYSQKFQSLAEQFGPGCQVFFLDDPNLQCKLAKAIDAGWESAEQYKPQLLAAAVRQIGLGQGAYRRLYDLVESRKRETAMGNNPQ